MSEPSAEQLLAEAVTAPARWSARTYALAERAISDTLALGIGGLREEQTELARVAVRPDSPAAVAHLGGVACHALDWDDYMHPMHGHCSAVLLPAAWAVLAGTGSGADLVDAFLTGYQVDHLLSLVTSHGHYHHGWHATSTVGAVGAAASAARALGLSTTEAGHALGIAASAAAGLRANFGTPTKALHAGQAARAGVEAAQIAAAGGRSSPSWLTGTYGFANVLSADRAPGEAAGVIGEFVATGLHGIETPWGLAQKPYACCGSSHAGLDALITLVTEHDLRAEHLDRVELHVDRSVPRVMPYATPSDPYDARYCLPWVVAAAAHDRALGPAQVSAEALRRTELHDLMARVRIVADLQVGDADRYAGRIVVGTGAGDLERTVHHAQGHPANPMTDAALHAKHTAALRHAGHEDGLPELLAFLAAVPTLDVLPHHWTK